MDTIIINRLAGHYQGRWMQGYVKGKLGSDPIFEAVWQHLVETKAPLLDIGCGVGLCAFYLRELGFQSEIHGIDFDDGKIQIARKIANTVGYSKITFRTQDACEPIDFYGNVVLLDVLHYLPEEKQQKLLHQIASYIAPGGICLIRATPRDSSWRFRMTRIEEWFLIKCGWMKSGAIHYLTVSEIAAPFEAAGFVVEAAPLWGRTPLNSHLFIFRKPVVR